MECGGQHTLALDRQGRVYSWGINDQGALGRVTSDDIKPPSDAMMMEDSGSEDEDDLKGNEAWVPNHVDIRREDGQPAFVVQVRYP